MLDILAYIYAYIRVSVPNDRCLSFGTQRNSIDRLNVYEFTGVMLQNERSFIVNKSRHSVQ